MSEATFKTLSKRLADREGLAGSAILISVIFMIGLLLAWASWAELDSVTRGQGRVISSAQNQFVQASEGGVILRRFVSENSLVSEGDALFEIDPLDAISDLNRLTQRLASLEIKETRLRAEIEGSDFTISSELSALAPMVAITELSLFEARRQALSRAQEVLRQQLLQRQQDLQSAQATVGTADNIGIFLEEEIAFVRPLVDDNIAPATRLLELQRQLEQVRGDRDRALISIEQATTKITELEMEIVNTEANYQLNAMEELNSVVAEQSELRASLPSLEERVSRALIRAPLDGIVSRLNFRTTGGVVNKGDIVLELVPTGEALMIEAQIMPQDISRINLDDTVRIRLSAYDSAKYGTVDGRVIRVSPDAIVDGTNGETTHYLVYVAIESELILGDSNETATLIPGMTATVDVISGKRTVLEYIWQPLARVQELALRD